MTMTRRAALAAIAAIAAAGPARAFGPAEAKAFVADVVAEITAIVRSADAANPRVDEFLTLFRRTAALPEIGRFTLGPIWREMTEAQRATFLEAFERYAARAYTARLADYQGESMTVDGARDAGQRGVLVNTTLRQPGQAPIRIEWLVSNRSGTPRIVDIIAEGISISIMQREEFAAMLERRGRDIDRFIADLDQLG